MMLSSESCNCSDLHRFGDLSSRSIEKIILDKKRGASKFSCRRNGEQTHEYRYYITSQSLDACKHGETIRSHWEIENKLHYVLDVIFDEYTNISRKDHLAKNFTTLRKVCMNLLRFAKVDKKTLKSTARKALMFPEFAFELIENLDFWRVGALRDLALKKVRKIIDKTVDIA